MGARTRAGWLATALTAVGLGLLVAGMWRADGAVAANVNVNVGSGGNNFAPKDIDIATGDTITFSRVGGTHNVTFVGGFTFSAQFNMSATQAVAGPFNSDATYYWYCNIHAGPGDADAAGLLAGEMVGRVIVGAGGDPPTNTPTRTPTNTTVPMSPTATNTQGAPTATSTQGVPTTTGTVPSAPGEYRSFAPNASRQ
ncbi:MAG: cupredoxin domain-containing protein [Tepidiformaceae bacterium]